MDHARVTTAQGIHSVLAYVYANAAARTGATGFTSADVGKIAQQADDSSFWLLLDTVPTWLRIFLAASYLPLVAGNQSAGPTYTLIGALPATDWTSFSSTLTLKTLVQIPAASTAQVRLYDVTNSAVLHESSVVSGPQTNHDMGASGLTKPTGVAVVELWLSTPTNTGGNAVCLAAGLY